MKKFFLGVIVVLLLELLVGGALVFLYWQNRIFNDEGISEVYVYKDTLKVTNNEKTIGNKVIENDLFDVNIKENGNVEMVKEYEKRYEINKPDIDLWFFSYVLKQIPDTQTDEKTSPVKQFLYNYYALYKEDYTNILKYIYQTNFSNKDQVINLLKDTLQKDRNELLTKNKTIEDVKKEIENIGNISIYQSNNYCYNDYCSYEKNDIKKIYQYIENAIMKNNELYGYIKADSIKYGFSPKLYYSILIIENMRQHTTNKGLFKDFLKFSVPQLSVMSKFSFGMFGTKTNMIHKMANWNYNGSIFHIDSAILTHVKNNFMTFNEETKRWDITNEQGLIDYIVNNKKIQVGIITDYFRMQQQARKKYVPDFNEAPGILVTLYNIGGFKTPHDKPEMGGASFNFLGYDISFGGLGEQIFYSINMDYIIYSLEKNYKEKTNGR